MVEIIWTHRALKDIDQIAEYIAKDSLQYAKEQVKQIDESLIGIVTIHHQSMLLRIIPH